MPIQMLECPNCGTQVSNLADECPVCKLSIDEIKKPRNPFDKYKEPEKEFHGIYRHDYFKNEDIPVYCPRCNSDNCEYFVESRTVAAKTKTDTRYTVNLNPLHPFTLVNKKEKTKIVSPERTESYSRILCKNCGNVFG